MSLRSGGNTSFDELKNLQGKAWSLSYAPKNLIGLAKVSSGNFEAQKLSQAGSARSGKRLQKGEPSDMTPDRIEKLQEIGFEFVTNPKVPSASKKESGEDDKNKKEKVVAESYMSDTEGAQESAQV